MRAPSVIVEDIIGALTHSAEVHVQNLLGSLCCCCFFSASHFTLSASLHLRINVDSGKLPGKPDEMFFFFVEGGGELVMHWHSIQWLYSFSLLKLG